MGDLNLVGIKKFEYLKNLGLAQIIPEDESSLKNENGNLLD
jgi:hypothetical protein